MFMFSTACRSKQHNLQLIIYFHFERIKYSTVYTRIPWNFKSFYVLKELNIQRYTSAYREILSVLFFERIKYSTVNTRIPWNFKFVYILKELNILRYMPLYPEILTLVIEIFTVYAAMYHEVLCLLLLQFCFVLVDYSMSILVYQNIHLHLFVSNYLVTKMLFTLTNIFLHSLCFPFIIKIKIDSEIKHNS